MCGRLRLSSDFTEITNGWKVPPTESRVNFAANWNAAPTDMLPICLFDRELQVRSLSLARWGLLPFWAKDEKISYSTFNAQSETVDVKPAFREAFRRGRRCLVPADNFYEWKSVGPKEKQPYAVARADGQLLALAGLWENWRNPASGETIRSFTILTCAPNEAMSALHTRMPVILAEGDWPQWLGEAKADAAALEALLRPCPARDLTMWPVDRRVGNVRNNDPSLILPCDL